MSNTKIDFRYLSEKDMIEAGVLDAARCVETMRETISLFGKHDFLQGGPKGDEHGLQVNFPAVSNIPDFPLDDAPDKRIMAMPAYLGGKYHIAGQKFYGSNGNNSQLGLPRSILMVSLIDVNTGAPVAHMSANLLSAMRTGAMPAMAATYLSCKNPKVVSLIGPGVINKTAFMCYMAVLPTLEVVKIKGSSPTSKTAVKMKAFIEKEYPQIKEIIICDTLEEACRDVDIVSEAMSVTKDDMPEFKFEWFKKGACVFSMGSFYTKDYDVFLKSKMVVDNQGMYEKYMNNFVARGEFDERGKKREWCIMGMHFEHLLRVKKIEERQIIKLADLINGIATGRESEDDIVMCSIGGMPIEDLSWGYECYTTAVEKGIGTVLNLWDEPYMK